MKILLLNKFLNKGMWVYRDLKNLSCPEGAFKHGTVNSFLNILALSNTLSYKSNFESDYFSIFFEYS